METLVSACAFVAFLLIFCINLDFGEMGEGLRQHDVVDAINYKARRNPSIVSMASDGTSTRPNPRIITGRPMQS